MSSVQRTSNANSNQTYSFTYDALGNMTSLKVGGQTLATYTYQIGTGLLLTQTYANGNNVSFTYDNLGRTKTATYSDGRVLTYAYDGEGRLYSATVTGNGASETYLYTYDSIGRLIYSEQKEGYTSVLRTNQAYNAYNQLTKQAWQMGSTAYSETYTYNASDGSLNTMTTGVGTTLTMGYDGLRRLSTVTGDPFNRSYAYRDISGTATTLQVSQLSYPNLGSGVSFGYTYDNLGNIATYTAPDGEVITYSYDNQGQLLKAEGDATYTYVYDSVGNILAANGHTYTYGDANWKDLLTAFDGNSITYDASGNPTSYYNGTRWNFTWANGRSLATASDGTTSLSFTYDTNGLRTSKKVGSVTHKYLYAGGKLMRETYGSNTLDFFYDANGTPYALKYNGTVYYYVTNLQGDVIRVVDASGNTVASYEYDPYGKVISAMGTLAEINPICYRGYYYDTETGFYYLQSRYYDPATGRFLNADNLLNPNDVIGANLLAYCRNNPVNNVDSWGNKPKDLFDSIDEAAYDFANYINGKSIAQNREYATYIYAVDVSGAPPLLLFMLKLIGADAFVNKIVKIKYTYVNPAKGTKDSSLMPINWFGIHNTVAIAHTHAAYSPEYINNSFSDVDMAVANKRGIPTYVATPLGLLRRYDPADGSDIIIYWDIPSDPNYPDL